MITYYAAIIQVHLAYLVLVGLQALTDTGGQAAPIEGKFTGYC